MTKVIKHYETPDTAAERTAPLPIFVPYWIRTMMIANKLTPDDLKKPAKLKKYMSKQDLIDWMALEHIFQNGFMVNGNRAIMDALNETKSPSAAANLMREIQAAAPDVLARLSTPLCDEQRDDKKLKLSYEIQHLDEENFLIYVEEDFVSSLQRREQVVKWLSECLKVQYSYASLSRVSRSALFKMYVQAMNPFFQLPLLNSGA